MDYFIKTYTCRCKTELAEYCFKRKGNTFARVRNDVLQNFSLKRFRTGHFCSVEFGIVPLCMKIPYVDLGIYELKRFEVAHHDTLWDVWEYKSNSTASIDACISELLTYIIKYLVPLFECASSCKAAFPELLSLERRFYENSLAGLSERGVVSKEVRTRPINYLDDAKYYMALKNGDYEFALRCREALLQQNMDAYNSMSERGYLTEEDRIRREKSLVKLRNDIEHLEANNIPYFQKMLEINEMNSRESLKEFL